MLGRSSVASWIHLPNFSGYMSQPYDLSQLNTPSSIGTSPYTGEREGALAHHMEGCTYQQPGLATRIGMTGQTTSWALTLLLLVIVMVRGRRMDTSTGTDSDARNVPTSAVSSSIPIVSLSLKAPASIGNGCGYARAPIPVGNTGYIEGVLPRLRYLFHCGIHLPGEGSTVG